MKTTTVSIGHYISKGRDIVPAIIGRRAIWTASNGDRIEGVIEAPTRWSSDYPIIRFPDGKWGRCDDTIEIIEG